MYNWHFFPLGAALYNSLTVKLYLGSSLYERCTKLAHPSAMLQLPLMIFAVTLHVSGHKLFATHAVCSPLCTGQRRAAGVGEPHHGVCVGDRHGLRHERGAGGLHQCQLPHHHHWCARALQPC